MALVATSLKLPKALKARVARLAKRAGESPHACMVRLLEERVEDAERFQEFIEDARQADLQMQGTREGYGADEVHRYLEAKVEGRSARKPKPVRWPD